MAGFAVATVEAGGHAAAEAGGRGRAIAAPLGCRPLRAGSFRRKLKLQVRWFRGTHALRPYKYQTDKVQKKR
jgi:hypothetical protein